MEITVTKTYDIEENHVIEDVIEEFEANDWDEDLTFEYVVDTVLYWNYGIDVDDLDEEERTKIYVTLIRKLPKNYLPKLYIFPIDPPLIP